MKTAMGLFSKKASNRPVTPAGARTPGLGFVTRTATPLNVVPVTPKPASAGVLMIHTEDSMENGYVKQEDTKPTNPKSYDYGGEDREKDYASKSASQDESEDMRTQIHHRHEVTEEKQSHLSSLFNGHLMKWKYEAEEGSAFIRLPAFCGALALITTSVIPLVLYPEAWTPHSIVMSACVIIMALFVVILDGRFISTNPLGARAHLRGVLTRNFNIFRYVWGRGILYIIAGVLNAAQLWLITLCSGAFMIVMGIISLIVGIHASRKFTALRSSLADESFLLLVFSTYDVDGDGYVAPYEFALLLQDLGMELDDRYTLKAFSVIDTDNDRRISFTEFNQWWAAGYVERGRRRKLAGDEYQRMD